MPCFDRNTFLPGYTAEITRALTLRLTKEFKICPMFSFFLPVLSKIELQLISGTNIYLFHAELAGVAWSGNGPGA